MNAFRTALHDRLFAVTKPIASSPLFPWAYLIAYVNLGTMCLGLQSDGPFEIAKISWSGWLLGSLFLFAAALKLGEIIRRKPAR